MMQAKSLTKRFEGVPAVEGVNLEIPSGSVFGLVGANGAGKSTLLRCLAGVYRPNEGEVRFNGEPVYENPAVKANLCFVSDELYFLSGATPARMAKLYASAYSSFDLPQFQALCEGFRLPQSGQIQTFSKGMRRLCATALALAVKPAVLFFDETMDGLDPIMRHLVKSVIVEAVSEREMTAVVVSHSMRELEEFCDHLALIHRGGIVLEQDVQGLKTSLFKVQVAFENPFTREKFSALPVVHYRQSGQVAEMIVSGDRAYAEEALRQMFPLLLEMLPLTLEEVFTYELQARGYDFQSMMEGISHEEEPV